MSTGQLLLRLVSEACQTSTSARVSIERPEDDDISDALQKVCDNDYYSDYDAMYSVEAVKVVRREMFQQKCLFNG